VADSTSLSQFTAWDEAAAAMQLNELRAVGCLSLCWILEEYPDMMLRGENWPWAIKYLTCSLHVVITIWGFDLVLELFSREPPIRGLE
jgi:hypothetical protein